MPSVAAGLLVFTSSAAVLVIEILAARLLVPFVGDTLETYTAIIGTILAGIAMGTWIGGRLADRVSPRALLGPTLVLAGALAMVAFPVVNLIGPALIGGGPPATVVLAFLGFFAPATVLSAVTPTVIKLQLSRLDQTGTVVGRLSGLGTAGAIAGTFLTGFVLVAAFPSRPVLLVLGAALIIGGVGIHLWLRPARSQPLAGIVAIGLFGAAVTPFVPSACEVESAYYCARVLDDLPPCEGRTLYLDTLRHSCVHLDDPTRLDFSYAQILADVIATAAPAGAPLDALHIGGGGFTMPRYLRAVRPGSQSLVLELDPTLVQIAREELGLRTGPDLQVRVGDARIALAQQPPGAYDLVIGDAFGGLAVPWHLTTKEVTTDIRRTLRDGGIYAVNLIDYPPLGFARAETATLRAVFEHVAVIAPADRLEGRSGGNFVLVASDAPVDVEGIRAHNAARGDSDVVITGAALDDFVGDARVLTDDFAPVDQLLTPA